jgi:hypothetical protein
MRRRTMATGITATALTCCGAIAALTSTALAPAGGSVETATVTELTGSPGNVYSRPAVVGMFEEQGGPVRPLPKGSTDTRPLSGVVMFTNKEGRTTAVTAGANGHFIAQLPAGTYTVTARTPQIERANQSGTLSDLPCVGPETVVVQSKTTATPLTLVCYVP